LSFEGITLRCTFTFSSETQPSRVFFFKLHTTYHFKLTTWNMAITGQSSWTDAGEITYPSLLCTLHPWNLPTNLICISCFPLCTLIFKFQMRKCGYIMFEISMAVKIWINVWVIMPRSVVSCNKHFRGMYQLNLLSRRWSWYVYNHTTLHSTVNQRPKTMKWEDDIWLLLNVISYSFLMTVILISYCHLHTTF
jgi:hypothetical protein